MATDVCYNFVIYRVAFAKQSEVKMVSEMYYKVAYVNYRKQWRDVHNVHGQVAKFDRLSDAQHKESELRNRKLFPASETMIVKVVTAPVSDLDTKEVVQVTEYSIIC